MSRLSRALLANLMVIGLTSAFAAFLVLTAIIGQAFGGLERESLQRNVDRAQAFMAEIMQTNMARAKDWGVWDDTFRYLNGTNPDYEARNLASESFVNAKVEGMGFVAFDTTKEARGFYFDNATGEARPDLARELRQLVTSKEFRGKAGSHLEFSTFLRFDGRLYVLSCVQVFQSDHSGVSPGYMVFINPVSETLISKALQAKGTFTFDRLQPTILTVAANRELHVSAPVFADNGRVAAMLNFSMPRTLVETGKRLRNMALLAIVAVVLAMILILTYRIRSLVLAPVQRLQGHVARIRQTGELQPIGGTVRDDELGRLQAEFDAMAAELQALRSEYEAQSFALGRSQNAIGTVHNIRNSLSPVNVLLSTLDRALGCAIPPEATRALNELADPKTPLDRRRRLSEYLALLMEELDRSLGDARGYTREAGRGLASAIDAISGSQDPDRADYGEACELGVLLGHAANAARYAEGLQIEVSIDYPQRILAQGNRVLLNQVLENLVTNAVEAIQAGGGRQGLVSISATLQPDAGACLVSVRDSGEGFAPEAAPQFFERGYSTRQSKRGGLGLHWCANTLTAMGGKLSLVSEGRGKGAVATIELPLYDAARAEQQAA